MKEAIKQIKATINKHKQLEANRSKQVLLIQEKLALIDLLQLQVSKEATTHLKASLLLDQEIIMSNLTELRSNLNKLESDLAILEKLSSNNVRFVNS